VCVQKVCEITGCRAFHRFTGNQIAKIYQTQSQAYANTEVVFEVFSVHLFYQNTMLSSDKH